MIRVYTGLDTGYTFHKVDQDLQSEYSDAEIENVERFDGFKDDINSLLDSVNVFSLFSNKKLIIFTDAYFFSDGNEKKGPVKESDQNYSGLEDYMKNPNPQTDLIFVVPGRLNRKGKLGKALSFDGVQIVNCEVPSDEDFIFLAFKIAKERSKEISSEASKMLIERTKGDYLAYINNLDKLFAYTDKVTVNDVEELVYRPLDDRIFDLLKFMLKNNVSKALSLYADLLRLGLTALNILPALASQIANMACIRFLKDKGATNEEIAKELKVKPGAIYYNLKDMAGLNYRSFIRMLDGLATIEKRIKLYQDKGETLLEIYIITFTNNYLRVR